MPGHGGSGKGRPYRRKFTLSDKAALEIMKLFLTRDEDLYDRTITDVFTEEFFRSNFWLYWRTMFAFETWHSALEMKLYLQRFIHHIGGLPDFSALKFTQYNQYESLILPMVHYLKEHNVQFQYDTQVTNVIFDIAPGRKVAKQLVWVREGREEVRELTEDDLVFVTNGSCTENSSLGSNDRAPEFLTEPVGGCWQLWRNIAAQDPAFGRPDKYCTKPGLTNWGVGHRHHPGRQDPALSGKGMQAGPLLREGGHRRYRHGEGLRLDDELYLQPPAPLQGPAGGAAGGVDLRPVHRCPRGLCEKAHAGVYRPGDLHGVAVPPGGAGGGDPPAGGAVCQHHPLHDALHHRLLYAPGPGGTGPTWCRRAV